MKPEKGYYAPVIKHAIYCTLGLLISIFLIVCALRWSNDQLKEKLKGYQCVYYGSGLNCIRYIRKTNVQTKTIFNATEIA